MRCCSFYISRTVTDFSPEHVSYCMGYECPVCTTEEADGEHLANHLAFTALIRGGEHETWLDEHTPNWAERDPDELASELTEYATETETEPTSVPQHHTHGTSPPDGHGATQVDHTDRGDHSGDTADILAEAKAMTRQMYGDEVDRGETDGSENSDTETSREPTNSDTDSENE